jgi:outer membrane protein assembly factor BamB
MGFSFPVGAVEPVVNFRNGGTAAWPDADPPLEWSVTKNVKWRWDGPLSGETFATPIIVGNRVITMANPMTLVALDKDTGKELWRRERYMEGPRGKDDVEWILHEFVARDYRLREIKGLLAVDVTDNKGRAQLPEMFGPIQKRLSYFAGKVKGDEKAVAYFQELLGRTVAWRKAVADDAKKKEELEKEVADLEAWKKGLNPILSVLKVDWSYTGATPASDGERIYAVISPGWVVCVDLNGKPLWTHAICEPAERQMVLSGTGKWGSATCAEAPVCADGKVLVHLGRRLQCLDAVTGAILWSYEQGPKGGQLAVTPVTARSGGVWYWMTGDGAVGRLDSGKVLMTAKNGDLGMYWSLARDADHRTFHYVRGAVRLPETPEGTPRQLWAMPENRFSTWKEKTDVAWIIEGGHSYFAPAVHNGLLYFFETCGGGRLTAMDAGTGEVVYGPIIAKEDTKGHAKKNVEENAKGPNAELGGNFVKCAHSPRAAYADLNLAGDYLIMFSEDGDSIVLKAGREFKVVRRNPVMGTTMVADPMFEGRRMYVRTEWSLFCIGDDNE